MTLYFKKDNFQCLCHECYYGIHILKWDYMRVYQSNGLNISEGTLITPSLVSSILNICQDLFKYQYKITPQTLKDLCATKIYYNKLNEDLLPRELQIYCRNVVRAELPVWYPQWTVPSVFIRHLDFTVSSKEQTNVRVQRTIVIHPADKAKYQTLWFATRIVYCYHTPDGLLS